MALQSRVAGTSKATEVPIADTGELFAAVNVEAALAEVKAQSDGSLSFAQSATGGGRAIVSTANASGDVTIDLALGNVHVLTLTADVQSIAVSGATNGRECRFRLHFIQDVATAYTVDYGNPWKWADRIAHVMSTALASRDIVEVTTLDGGATMFADVIGQGYAPLTAPPPDIWATAIADWVASDSAGGTWTDRIGAKVFTPSGSPSWNPLAQAWDLDGVNDYFETPDHADFNFVSGQDFTIAVVLESLVLGQVDKAILSKKASTLAATQGWMLRTSATGTLEFVGSDGTTQVSRATQAMPTVAATVGGRMASDVGSTFVEATASATSSFSTVGSLSTTNVVRLGASSATPTLFGAFRIFRVTIWRYAI